MTSRRYVLDTNCVVSATLFKQSPARLAFEKAKEIGTILQSPETIAELHEMLYREKFDRYLSNEDRIEFLDTLKEDAELIATTTTVTDCRDPKDNKFLALAIDGQATCIITGDTDLLDMNPYHDIAIITLREFLDRE